MLKEIVTLVPIIGMLWISLGILIYPAFYEKKWANIIWFIVPLIGVVFDWYDKKKAKRNIKK